MCQPQIDWRSVWLQLEKPFEAVQVPGAASPQGPGVCCEDIQPGKAAVGAVSLPAFLLSVHEYLVLQPVLSCLEVFSLRLVFQTVIFYL